MFATRKWIGGLSRKTTVVQAAQLTLRDRLHAVKSLFELAAKRGNQDREAIHQCRVATRRAIAAIDLYVDVLPKHQVKWFQKRLRQIRRIAGRARDLDVLVAKHVIDTDDPAADDLRKTIHAERTAAQLAIKKLYRKLIRRGTFERHVEKLMNGICVPSDCRASPRFSTWARLQFHKSAKRFLRTTLSPDASIQELHRYRIRGKTLRYTMELLATAFPKQFRTELYPIVTAFQDPFGDINDLAVACDYLQTWLDTGDAKQRRYLNHLLHQKREQLSAAVEVITLAWTPQRADELRARFVRFGKPTKRTRRGPRPR